MEPRQIGKMIRFHRKKAGLTQEELGKYAGLGKTVIFDVEQGKLSIRYDTLLKIVEVLTVKITFTSQFMADFEEQLNAES